MSNSKMAIAREYIIHKLIIDKMVSLDEYSKYVSNNIGSINLYEPISQLRRFGYIIGLSEDYKYYILLQRKDGIKMFEEGYATKIAKTNNKFSSRELWRVFKYDGDYYFKNQFEYKDVPLVLYEV